MRLCQGSPARLYNIWLEVLHRADEALMAAQIDGSSPNEGGDPVGP